MILNKTGKETLFGPSAIQLNLAKPAPLPCGPSFSAHILPLQHVVFVLLGIPALAAVERRLPGACVGHAARGGSAVFGIGVGIAAALAVGRFGLEKGCSEVRNVVAGRVVSGARHPGLPGELGPCVLQLRFD
jgi:hypothetical protein